MSLTVNVDELAAAFNIRNKKMITAIRHGLRDAQQGSTYFLYPWDDTPGSAPAEPIYQWSYRLGVSVGRSLLEYPYRLRSDKKSIIRPTKRR